MPLEEDRVIRRKRAVYKVSGVAALLLGSTLSQRTGLSKELFEPKVRLSLTLAQRSWTFDCQVLDPGGKTSR